jgi:hypothetical protein
MWASAERTFRALGALLARVAASAPVDIDGEMVIPLAARPVGYFYLCDYLRNGLHHNALRQAKESWDLLDRTTRDKTTMLYRDMAEKIRILSALVSAPGSTFELGLACTDTCPADMD